MTDRREEGRAEFFAWLRAATGYALDVYPDDARQAVDLVAFQLCTMLDGVGGDCDLKAVYRGVNIGGGLHEEVHHHPPLEVAK